MGQWRKGRLGHDRDRRSGALERRCLVHCPDRCQRRTDGGLGQRRYRCLGRRLLGQHCALGWQYLESMAESNQREPHRGFRRRAQRRLGCRLCRHGRALGRHAVVGPEAARGRLVGLELPAGRHILHGNWMGKHGVVVGFEYRAQRRLAHGRLDVCWLGWGLHGASSEPLERYGMVEFQRTSRRSRNMAQCT